MVYVVGSLFEVFDFVVVMYVLFCDECCVCFGVYEVVGGYFVEMVEVVELSDDVFVKMMVLIVEQDGEQIKVFVLCIDGIFFMLLCNYVGGDKDVVKWCLVGGGVCQMILLIKGNVFVWLLYIFVGVFVLDYGYCGIELMLVLQGVFCDEID